MLTRAVLVCRYLLRQLVRGETEDMNFAVYAPSFTPADSILSLLEAHRRFPEEVVRHFAAQLVLGARLFEQALAHQRVVICARAAIGYLHSKKLTFFHLSPDYVFVNGDGNITGLLHCSFTCDSCSCHCAQASMCCLR